MIPLIPEKWWSANVVIAATICFFCSCPPSPAGAANTIADAEAQCGAAVKAETWPEAADDCSSLVRNLSDILTAKSDLPKTDRLALEEGMVTFAAVTAHAYAEIGDLKDAKLYIFIATKELTLATSDGLSTDSERYHELKGAIDTAAADLPTS